MTEKQSKQYGKWVKASDELPEERNDYNCKYDGYPVTILFNDKSGEIKNGAGYVYTNEQLQLIEWLKPVTGILLQKDEWEGLMKCVEALKEMVRCHAVFKDDLLVADVTLQEHVNATNAAKQSLSQLKIKS